YRKAADRLAAMLNDYDSVVMPSSQRIFLIDKMRALFPGDGYSFPMDAAERLAVRLVDSQDPIGRRSRNAVTATALSDAFALASPSGRVIAIYRAATVLAAVTDLLQGQ